MTATRRQGTLMATRFGADQQNVELCIDQLRGVLAQGYAEIAFDMELLARETLSNALRHGCREDASKSIGFRLEALPEGLRLSVEDEGEGFDWREISFKPPDPESESGRGMSILRSYADDVQFNSVGNTVQQDIAGKTRMKRT